MSLRSAIARNPEGWRAAAWCGGIAPWLAFPELLWPGGRWPLALLAIVASGSAAVLFRRAGQLGLVVAVLALALTGGWLKAAGDKTALGHFCGAALGLTLCGTLLVWCRTLPRLTLAGIAFVALGGVALGVGLLGAAIPTPTKYLSAEYMPQVPLPLPNLEGGLVNPNALGVTALMVLPVALAFAALPAGASRWGRPVRVLSAITAAAAFVVIIITQSRSVWMGGWVITIVALTAWKASGGLRIWRLAALVTLVAVPLAAVLWVRTHLDPTVATAADRIQLRVAVWHQALDALRASPLSGIGINAYRHVQTVSADVPHAHNIFLQTALDTGLLGLGAYIALFAMIIREGYRTAIRAVPVSPIAAAGALTIIGVHVFGIVDAVALGAKVGLFQWWAAGLVLAASRLVPGEHRDVRISTSSK